MTREIYFSIIVALVILSVGIIVWITIQTREFSERANEIIRMYQVLEPYLIRDSKWSEEVDYPSKFYHIKFQTSKKAMEEMTVMIRDAIRCFKRQNSIGRSITKNLSDELDFIQSKLMTIYVLG